MKAEKFSRALEQVDNRYVMEAAQARPTGRIVLLNWKRWIAVAACLCLLATSVLAVRYFSVPEDTDLIVQTAPAADAPDGMRRFMNFGGLRYEFLENGAVYAISEEQLGKSLGTLTFDIFSDPESNAQKDFATTYALGGTVHELKGYSQSFRVAVEYDGNYYLCQSTAYTDGENLDIAPYFSAADFPENVLDITVYDHGGSNLLAVLPEAEMQAFISVLSQSTPAKLSEEQFQQIGQAQRDGKSFRVVFVLKDSTQYEFYLIPSLHLAMFGDGRYTLPQEFSTSFRSLFDGLVSESQPIH